MAAVNKTGTTQFRASFTLDDNDDLGSDYIGFYSEAKPPPATSRSW